MKKLYTLNKKHTYLEMPLSSRLKRDGQAQLSEIATKICNDLTRLGYGQQASEIFSFLEQVKNDVRLSETNEFGRKLTFDIGVLKAFFEIAIKFDTVKLDRIYEISVGY